MAIESVGNKKVAYQGRLSQKEVDIKGPEKNENISVEVSKVVPNSKEMKRNENSVENNLEKDKPIEKNSQLKKAVEEINNNSKQTEAIFGIHDDTNRVTIKIVDKKSKEVLKEFPPEQTLDMIAKVWEMAGIMVDERG